jgi:hypothetical protein
MVGFMGDWFLQWSRQAYRNGRHDSISGGRAFAPPFQKQKPQRASSPGLGDGANHVSDATESGDAVEDALDENANCGGNLWLETTFSAFYLH